MLNAMRNLGWRSFGIVMFALLSAGASARAQDGNEAEALLKKAEEKLSGAKTLQFAVNLEVQTDEPGRLEGTVKLEENNRVDMDLKGKKENGDAVSYHLSSDGERTKMEWGEGDHRPEFQEDETPQQLNRDLIVLLTRGGCLMSMGAVMMGPNRKKDLHTLSDFVRVSDVKMGRLEKIGDRDVQTIEFAIKASGGMTEFQGTATLWLDRTSYLPLKRVLVLKQGSRDREMTVTETYSTFKLDGKDPVRPGLRK